MVWYSIILISFNSISWRACWLDSFSRSFIVSSSQIKQFFTANRFLDKEEWVLRNEEQNGCDKSRWSSFIVWERKRRQKYDIHIKFIQFIHCRKICLPTNMKSALRGSFYTKWEMDLWELWKDEWKWIFVNNRGYLKFLRAIETFVDRTQLKEKWKVIVTHFL